MPEGARGCSHLEPNATGAPSRANRTDRGGDHWFRCRLYGDA